MTRMLQERELQREPRKERLAAPAPQRAAAQRKASPPESGPRTRTAPGIAFCFLRVLSSHGFCCGLRALLLGCACERPSPAQKQAASRDCVGLSRRGQSRLRELLRITQFGIYRIGYLSLMRRRRGVSGYICRLAAGRGAAVTSRELRSTNHESDLATHQSLVTHHPSLLNESLYFWSAWVYIAGLHRLRHGLEQKTEPYAPDQNQRPCDLQTVWASADAGDAAEPQSRGILDTGRQAGGVPGRMRLFRDRSGRVLPVSEPGGVVQGGGGPCAWRGDRRVARAGGFRAKRSLIFDCNPAGGLRGAHAGRIVHLAARGIPLVDELFLQPGRRARTLTLRTCTTTIKEKILCLQSRRKTAQPFFTRIGGRDSRLCSATAGR